MDNPRSTIRRNLGWNGHTTLKIASVKERVMDGKTRIEQAREEREERRRRGNVLARLDLLQDREE